MKISYEAKVALFTIGFMVSVCALLCVFGFLSNLIWEVAGLFAMFVFMTLVIVGFGLSVDWLRRKLQGLADRWVND